MSRFSQYRPLWRQLNANGALTIKVEEADIKRLQCGLSRMKGSEEEEMRALDIPVDPTIIRMTKNGDGTVTFKITGDEPATFAIIAQGNTDGLEENPTDS